MKELRVWLVRPQHEWLLDFARANGTTVRGLIIAAILKLQKNPKATMKAIKELETTMDAIDHDVNDHIKGTKEERLRQDQDSPGEVEMKKFYEGKRDDE